MHADRHTSRWVYTMFWTLTHHTFALEQIKIKSSDSMASKY